MLKAFFIFLFSIFYIFNIVVYKIMPVDLTNLEIPYSSSYSLISRTRKKTHHSPSSPSSSSSERSESAPPPLGRERSQGQLNMDYAAYLAAQAAAMAVVGVAATHAWLGNGKGKRRKRRSAAYKSRKRNIRRH